MNEIESDEMQTLAFFDMPEEEWLNLHDSLEQIIYLITRSYACDSNS